MNLCKLKHIFTPHVIYFFLILESNASAPKIPFHLGHSSISAKGRDQNQGSKYEGAMGRSVSPESDMSLPESLIWEI